MAEHHPRRKNREITDLAEMKEILRKGKYATIAMAKDNEAYLVTLSYGYDEAGSRLWFHAALKGEKLDFLAANPTVCATVIEDRGYLEGECEHAYRSLIIRGRMEIARDIEDRKHGLVVLLDHLEKDPAPILKRNIVDDASYDKVLMLSLSIEEMRGKQSSGSSS